MSKSYEINGEENVDVVDESNNNDKQTEGLQSQVKRRACKKRSEVWDHYDQFKDVNGAEKAKCKYCGSEYFSSTKNGTSALRTHLKHCVIYKTKMSSGQTQIAFESGDDERKMVTWKFDQKSNRNALAQMIIVDELPFRFVEGKGFRHYSSVSQPLFKIPCRTTITKDVYQIFLVEKKKVHDMLQKNIGRICLTTDSWTSIQKINYMSLTAHFVDNELKLRKKVLNLCLLESHRGAEIGKAIEKCLLEWNIDNVLTISVDNASSNDVAIDYLKEKYADWDKCLLQGKWIHIRCVAHILNLVVRDGIGFVGKSVDNIRGAVKWVRQSPSRLNNFRKYAEMEKCGSTKMLILDVSTRWNSTYLMLEMAQVYEKAFKRYNAKHEHFKEDLKKVHLGVPVSSDWENARKLTQFLKHFYDVTLKVSGTLYVTSHSVIDDISTVLVLLNDILKNPNDIGLYSMANIMKQKFDKYFGDIENTNMLLYISSVLDPRNKLVYMKVLLYDVYGEVDGEIMRKVVKKNLEELYADYVRVHAPSLTNESSSSSSVLGKRSTMDDSVSKPTIRNKLREKLKMEMSGTLDSKSELDKFLKESAEEDSDNFDILAWWKVNSPRFPILSLMARDLLAIPVSTVASESVFSTSGRVLDPFRSSLTPKIVESLVCAQDWLRTSPNESVEENWEHINQIDEELEEYGISKRVG